MSGKHGGARNPAKPWVDVGLLYECSKKHGAMVKNLGSYEHISSSSAVRLGKVGIQWHDPLTTTEASTAVPLGGNA